MVLAGQFLERPTLIESGHSCLEGLSHRGEKRPGLLICPPSPRRGSSMDSPVCAELAWAASQAGHPTLRFNYRGAGASQGVLSEDLDQTAADAEAALEALAANTAQGPIALAGYDYGAAVAVELLRRRPESLPPLAGLVLIAPGRPIDPGLSGLSLPRLLVVGAQDEVGRSAALAARGPTGKSGVELALVEGADRVFSCGLPALGRVVVEFLARLG